MENIFTSTGIKLLHHPEVITRMKMGLMTPISLQMAPTSECNLKCAFCSNSKRNKHESLKETDVLIGLSVMRTLGLKTVEWTGGGDPTMWEPLSRSIRFSSMLGLQQGLITNGVRLKDTLSYSELALLTWIRVSLNCINYVSDLQLPEIPGNVTVGFSYCIEEDDILDELKDKLMPYVEKYNPRYVRLVPNCLVSLTDQIYHNQFYSEHIDDWGKPFFYQKKVFNQTERCWWCYIKPFVLHDGWVYPCSSVVLNSGAEGRFHDRYRWCEFSHLPERYTNIAFAYNGNGCDHCVFSGNNELVDYVVNYKGMENFV